MFRKGLIGIATFALASCSYSPGLYVPEVEFPAVAPGGGSRGVIRLFNQGDEPAVVVAFTPPKDPFLWTAQARELLLTVPPSEVREIPVWFHPVAPGAYAGEASLVVEVGGARSRVLIPLRAVSAWTSPCGAGEVAFAPEASALGKRSARLEFTAEVTGTPVHSVPLEGLAGGPQIELPLGGELDFGDVRFFSVSFPPVVAKAFRIRNVGRAAPPAWNGRLRLGKIGPDGSVIPGSQFSLSPRLPEFYVSISSPYVEQEGIRPPPDVNWVDVDVVFAPGWWGTRTTVLEIFSDDPDEPVKALTLRGNVVPYPTCHYQVSPPELDFGAVPQGTTAERLVWITNPSTTAGSYCAVLGLDLTRPGVFSLPARPSLPALIHPGGVLEIPLRATPTSTFPVRGELKIWMSSTASPTSVVPLVAVSQ